MIRPELIKTNRMLLEAMNKLAEVKYELAVQERDAKIFPHEKDNVSQDVLMAVGTETQRAFEIIEAQQKNVESEIITNDDLLT